MGLREKAQQYRNEFFTFNIRKLEDIYSGRVLSKDELIRLQDTVNRQIDNVTSQLDRKLIDMQTLFEIGKELNSTLNLSDLIQIVIFTLIGQFQISQVAVYSLKSEEAVIIGQRGYDKLKSFSVSEQFVEFINYQEDSIHIDDLKNYRLEYNQLTNENIHNIIPMKGTDNLAGFIAIGNKINDEEYTEDEDNFIYTIGSLAGIALENARLFDELDKKYKELSTLYDVSKVINSTDDYDLVLSLIFETISTGFGVNKALLFLSNDENPKIERISGLDEELLGQYYNLNHIETELLKDNSVKIIPTNENLKAFIGSHEDCLFIPLQSAGNLVGGLIVFEFDNYEINPKNTDIVNLFAIIASQITPPILMTQILNTEKEKVQDPFTPVLTLIENEISQAGEFGIDVTFAMLKLNNFNQYVQLHTGEKAHQKFNELSSKLKKVTPDTASIVRYSSNKILFILPALADTDFDDFNEAVIHETNEVFKDETELDIGMGLLSAKYPTDSEDKFIILSLIE